MLEIIYLTIGILIGFACAFVRRRAKFTKYASLIEKIEQQWGENGVQLALSAFIQRMTQPKQETVKTQFDQRHKVRAAYAFGERPQSQQKKDRLPLPHHDATSCETTKKPKATMNAFALLREVSEGDSVWSEHANDLRRDGVMPQFLPPKEDTTSADDNE